MTNSSGKRGRYSRAYGVARRSLCRGGGEVRKYSKLLETSQWFCPDILRELQLQKIKDLVSYAYEHVPFYHERYKKEGFHPNDLRTIQDFQSLPFLTRDDVNQNFQKLISNEYRRGTFVDRTGGSTGQSMEFLMDKSTAYWSYAVEARCRGWYGVCEGDRRAWVWGAQKDFPSWKLKDRVKARIKRYRYLNTNTMDQASMDGFARMLSKWQPAMFRAYPVALALFASFLKDSNYKEIRPKLIETTSEKVTAAQRELFEDVFQCKVADCYSSWEIYDIAYQCPEGSLHVNEDRYLELLNNDTIVDDGEIGEVVVTGMTQYAFPFIRYKNEDLGILKPGLCSCGRCMPVLQEVTGRKIDVLVREDGTLIHGASVCMVFKYRPEVVKFQLQQDDRLNVRVRIVCRAPTSVAMVESIRDEIRTFLGERVSVDVQVVDDIELTVSGKHKYIVSRIAPDLTDLRSIERVEM